jgi:hypothetical protein
MYTSHSLVVERERSILLLGILFVIYAQCVGNTNAAAIRTLRMHLAPTNHHLQHNFQNFTRLRTIVMFSPQSSAQLRNNDLSSDTTLLRSPVSLARNLLGSLHLVRQLFAYYANWRSASRVFDEEIDLMLDRAAVSSEKLFEKLPDA